jgi:hypothetical protein
MVVATAKRAFIENAQQRIQDCRRPEKHLIEKGNLGVWKHAHNFGFDNALFEFPQVDRAKNFGRFGKASQQVLEVAPAQPARNPTNRLAFRGSGWPNHEHVLSCDGAEDHKFDQCLAIHQAAASRSDGNANMFHG